MTKYRVDARNETGHGLSEFLSAPDAGTALVEFAKRNPFRNDRTAHYYVEEARYE
jgi:hypothetical protein